MDLKEDLAQLKTELLNIGQGKILRIREWEIQKGM